MNVFYNCTERKSTIPESIEDYMFCEKYQEKKTVKLVRFKRAIYQQDQTALEGRYFIGSWKTEHDKNCKSWVRDLSPEDERRLREGLEIEI